jgi:hypothetical protein
LRAIAFRRQGEYPLRGVPVSSRNEQMYKAFEYRLFPNRSQHARLLSCLAESRRLYNEMLELVKAHYDESGTFLGRYDPTYRFNGRGGEHVPQSTVQTLADRLDRALKRFSTVASLGRRWDSRASRELTAGIRYGFDSTGGGGMRTSTLMRDSCEFPRNSEAA